MNYQLKVLFPLLVLLMDFGNLVAQKRFIFIDSETNEKITDVRLITKDGQLLISDINGQIEIKEKIEFPFHISRLGYRDSLIDKADFSVENILMIPNGKLQEIKIVSDKNKGLKRLYGNNLSTVKDIRELKLQGKTETKEIIQSFSELQIKDYGSSSGFQTFSARGTSASQNVIVVDGMIINDLTTGTANLAVIPVSNFDLITVQTGGFSADVSTGAFGSTLYLDSGNGGEDKTEVTYTKGSFGHNKIETFVSQSDGNEFWSGKLRYDHSVGNYPYDFQTLGKTEKRNRENNENKSVSVSGDFLWNVSGWKLNNMLLSTIQMQGIPGPVFFDNEFSSNADLALSDVKFISSVSTIINESILRFSSMLKFQQYDYSENKKYPAVSINDFYNEKEISFRGDWLSRLNENNLNSGFYFRYNYFSSNQLNPVLDKNNVSRLSGSLFCDYEKKITENLYQKLSGRIESVSQFSPSVSGSYSISLKSIDFEYLISVSRMIRYPSFTELHFTSLSDPKLITEKYKGFDAGIKYSGKNISGQIKSFAYLINDKIISIPKNPVQWTTLNLDEVRGIGIEQNSNIVFSSLNLSESVTLQSVKNYHTISSQTEGKEVVYAPDITAYFSVKYQSEKYSVFSDARYNGDEFYSAENLKDEMLDGFLIVNCGINYFLKYNNTRIEFQIQTKNVFDERYEWVKSYPQPGRSFEFTVGLSQ